MPEDTKSDLDERAGFTTGKPSLSTISLGILRLRTTGTFANSLVGSVHQTHNR